MAILDPALFFVGRTDQSCIEEKQPAINGRG